MPSVLSAIEKRFQSPSSTVDSPARFFSDVKSNETKVDL